MTKPSGAFAKVFEGRGRETARQSPEEELVTRPPDFELRGHLKARRLRAWVSPSAQVEADSPAVGLDHRRRRTNVPDRLEEGEEYADVKVGHEVVGRIER